MNHPTGYDDFVVTICGDEPGRLEVRLLESPRLEHGGSLRVPFESPYQPHEIDRLLRDLETRNGGQGQAKCFLPGLGLVASGAPRERVDSKEVGERLFDALFSGEVLHHLERCLVSCDDRPERGLRIRLVLDPENPHTAHLATLPWELLRNRKKRSFLCRSSTTPLVRHLDVERPPALPLAEPPLQVLVAMANPSNTITLDLKRERSAIEEGWGRQESVKVTFLEHATLSGLRDALGTGRYHVLHFMGHGCFDDATGTGSLVFEDRSGGQVIVPAEVLVDNLRNSSPLRLAVLNACESGTFPRRQGLDAYSSVAAALILAGLPAVIAMQFPITDRAAIVFSTGFYAAAAAGRTIEDAMTEGRIALANPELPTREWATPVVYLRGRSSRLVKKQAGGGPVRHIIDRSGFIDEKTRGFVGRRFVFKAIDSFLDANSGGYFLLTGEPGIGKTSIAAELIQREGHCHHFIIRALRATTRTESFLPNICAQLIVSRGLEYETLPSNASRSSEFMVRLLEEIVAARKDDERVVLVLDALDEVDESELRRSGNLFDLPPSLPEGVYMILTAQGDRYRKVPLRLDSLREVFEIPASSPDNLEDVDTYIRSFLDRDGIRDYIAEQRIDSERFIAELVARSEGNFMYLHYVLPAIEAGQYAATELDQLPVGLTNYYEDLWLRMKKRAEKDWFDFKLPVLAALTVVRTPVSVGFIDRILSGKGGGRIGSVLAEWEPFLHKVPVATRGGTEFRYALYHGSFYDFIAGKDEVAGERVGLREMALRIARAGRKQRQRGQQH